jgi:hypothetical protein
MEVNLDEKSRAKMLALAEDPPRNMFDAALVNVDRDIMRSLQAFYVSDVFLTYMEHKGLIDDLANVQKEKKAEITEGRARSKTIGEDVSRDEVLVRVRNAY